MASSTGTGICRNTAEKSGEDEVFEKYKRVPGETRLLGDGGRLSIKAGRLEVVWSFARKGKGYIYYFPERVRVQIANAHDFEKIDLNRFAAGLPVQCEINQQGER